MTLDERRGVPSASAMERLMNCPASWHMEQHAPPEESREDAASGTRIHAVLAFQASVETLTGDEAETCEMCAAQANELISDYAGAAPDQVIRERRLGLTRIGSVIDVTPETRADFVFTGQTDVIVIKGNRALVIDYKTGRSDAITAVDNPQLAAYAVLVYWRYRVESVRVAIVQPWAGKPTVADYSLNALTLAHGWLMDALQRVEIATPEDTRAGEHCKWCKAKVGCNAYREAALQQIEVIDPMTIAGMDVATQRKAMFARAMALPAESLAGAVRGLGIVERYIEAIRAVAKMRAADDEHFRQWYVLREKEGRRRISDVQTVASRAFAHGVSVEDFTSFCAISLSATKDLLRKATGTKGKALEALLNEVIEGAHEVGNPVLELEEVKMEGGEE